MSAIADDFNEWGRLEDVVRCIRPGCGEPRGSSGTLCDEHAARVKGQPNGSMTRPVQSKEELKVYFRNQRDAKRELDEEEAGGIRLPEIVDLPTLFAEPDDPTPYRIHGLWPTQGRVICSAARKSGKTTLTGNLARCLADGAPFLNTFATTPVTGKIVILDTEMSRSQLRVWLRDQEIENPERVSVVPLRGQVDSFRITNEAVRAVWAEKLRDMGAEVIILDPLGPMLDACGADESDNTGVGRVLTALDALVSESGASELWISHHMGHGAERARGASKLRGWPDVEWMLLTEKDDDGNDADSGRRFFWAYGRDVEVAESELSFDSETRHLTLDTGTFGTGKPLTRKQAARERKLAAIVDIIGKNPGCPTSVIEGPGISSRTRPSLIAELIRSGRIHTVTEGRTTRHYIGSTEGTSDTDDESGDEVWTQPQAS